MHSKSLPQMERLFLTDAGLETDLIFKRGVNLPHFASIALLRTHDGRALLEDYFQAFIDLAGRAGTGCLLESASWRASSDWAEKLDLTAEGLQALSRESVLQLIELRRENQDKVEIVVSGCFGPRGDGYDAGSIMTIEEAKSYHLPQARAMASAGPDLLSAFTMTNVNEAAGIANAAEAVGLPVVISFTVETDGRLPAGDTLRTAIEIVDRETGGYPAYYMINCAHPTHFLSSLEHDSDWVRRIAGVRANASRCSHAELDAMTELDDGNPQELGQLYADLRRKMPWLNVLGGCCGTDLRHITAIAEAVAPKSEMSAAA